MSDRYNALVVVLEKDMRSDDAQSTIEAIRHIRGVLSVEPHIADIGAQIAYERARRALMAKLSDVLGGGTSTVLCGVKP